jgi:glycosyltransferase involved in cell wall biosynthesis
LATSPKFSVCITHFNNALTVERSLHSILDQVDERFEIVVVDQDSTDGSLEIIERLARDGAVRLFHQKVRNRGLGRNLAYEMSKGEYLIAQIDMDDSYEPVLADLVSAYENRLPGRVLRVVNNQKRGAVTIAPKSFLDEIGGWPDLNYVEDRWVWGRALEHGIYSWARYPFYSKITQSREKRGLLSRVVRVYGIQRDRIRIGAAPHVSKFTWPLYPFSYAAAKSAKRINRPVFKTFWPDDPKYCIEDFPRPDSAPPDT